MPPKPKLTDVTWAHAVNSQAHLEDALKSPIDMIEADIVMGKISATTAEIPIMAHPPAKSSDLSLDSFLQQIEEYNILNSKQMKGVKLDFKSIDVFESSLGILAERIPQMTYPVWLNADIIAGPVNQTNTIPVDPQRFFTGCWQFKNAVLSIGWTTKWSAEHDDGCYTSEHIEAMLEAIRNNKIIEMGRAITFPVRAGIAANSKSELCSLLNVLNETNVCTLTVWSSPDDYVDVGKLRFLIDSIGFDRIYLDVPKQLLQQLN